MARNFPTLTEDLAMWSDNRGLHRELELASMRARIEGRAPSWVYDLDDVISIEDDEIRLPVEDANDTEYDEENKISELSMLVAKEKYTCKGIGSGLVA